ncbi:uncharacterized protein LOC116658152 [Camelus ferus]|uniref:Uncharacterized protein LOC116658152 n=1 Tax=Camelus ferus TaxID=419612 RepID=A0A8B8RK33_CAMFR|nr:uncharacterized protein LOC116658152 [Camelus ferus]
MPGGDGGASQAAGGGPSSPRTEASSQALVQEGASGHLEDSAALPAPAPPPTAGAPGATLLPCEPKREPRTLSASLKTKQETQALSEVFSLATHAPPSRTDSGQQVARPAPCPVDGGTTGGSPASRGRDQEKRLRENQAETRTWDGRTAPPEALRALDGEDTALKTLRVIQERHTCLEVRESGPERPPNSSLHVEGWVAREEGGSQRGWACARPTPHCIQSAPPSRETPRSF